MNNSKFGEIKIDPRTRSKRYFFKISSFTENPKKNVQPVKGTPYEFYKYGGMYIWSLGSFAVSLILAAEIFMPIFYKLGVISTYEYLEMRYCKALRTATMIMFIIAGTWFILQLTCS